MKKKVNHVAEGYRALTPQITVKSASKAIEFYKKALGAELIGDLCAMPDGRIGHAVLKIGDSKLMLNDGFPEMGCAAPQGQASSASLYVYVADVDAVVKGAVALGAKLVRPVTDQFWGDREGTLQDPFGHVWSVATHVEDLTPAQIKERMETAFMVGAK
jgi:PhnB protein